MDSARLQIVEVVEATGGGTRRHLRDLLGGLDRDRFALSVIASARRESAFLADVATFRRTGVQVDLLPMVRAIHPWHDPLTLVRLVQRFRRSRPDVVHTHSSKAGFLGRCAARIARVPRIVHTPHCFAFCMDVAPAARRFYLGLERLAARWTDRIICVCPAERDAAIAAQVAAADRLVVIENGIAPRPASPTPEERLERRRKLGIPTDAFAVGTIGRLCRQKGLDFFLAAGRELLAQVPQARLVLVGDGELRKPLQAQAAESGIADRCIWTGHQEDAASLLPAMDVVAMPSRWEALPYVLLEAMAAARPLVVTAVGGMPEAVCSTGAGLVTEVGDVPGLTAALVRLARQPELRHEFGVNGRSAMSTRYRLCDMLEQTEILYANRPTQLQTEA